MEQIKKQDYATNKLLLIFTVAFGFIIYFMNIGRAMKDIRTYVPAWDGVKLAVWIGVGAIVLGIIIAVVERSM